MFGFKSSPPAATQPIELTVHTPPDLNVSRRGRWSLVGVLLVCIAPIAASYVSYYFIRPDKRTNYSELIEPQQPIPQNLPLFDLQNKAVVPQSLQGQWLLVVVSNGQCEALCEKMLLSQRQLHEALGRDKDRVDKLWLIVGDQPARAEVLTAVRQKGAEATVLRVSNTALSAWLKPKTGLALEPHFYLIDPMGHWMMRTPIDPDLAKLKRDLQRLLQANTVWDKPGRS
jgi:hypothetical protein